MALKDVKDYTPEEKQDYEYWKQFIAPENMKEEFLSIGNFEQIRSVYMSIKEEKQKLLEKRQKEFIPKVYMELETCFLEQKALVESQIEFLQVNDRESLEEKQRFFGGKVNAIKANVSEVFGDTINKIKTQKLDVNKTLRELSIDAAKLEMHTGTETHLGSNTSYAFQLGPFRWGKHTEHYSYTTTYTYLAASDALEQISAYGKQAASAIEEVFRQTIEIKAYRRKLLETVIQNFDTSDQDFDVNYFRVIVQNALNNIDFPEVHIDVSKELTEIGNQFSGEVRNHSDQDKFRNLLSTTVEKLYSSIVTKVDSTINDFQESMKKIQDTLCNDILEKVLKEFDAIKDELEEKDDAIHKDREYLDVIGNILNELEQ
jgi:hypothetical protein